MTLLYQALSLGMDVGEVGRVRLTQRVLTINEDTNIPRGLLRLADSLRVVSV